MVRKWGRGKRKAESESVETGKRGTDEERGEERVGLYHIKISLESQSCRCHKVVLR